MMDKIKNVDINNIQMITLTKLVRDNNPGMSLTNAHRVAQALKEVYKAGFAAGANHAR